ncbi:MAG: transcription antitermination factor NusB [Alphaproteobacteria bacterium]|nr:transcription antitermination factor NusB [Alphaproteobacteria bacterium]
MSDINPTQKFTNARLMAVQACYAKEVSDEMWDKVVSKFLLGEIGGQVIEDGIAGREKYIDLQPADAGLFTNIVKEYQEKEEMINEIIRSNLGESLDYERMELLLKCILRMGIAEFYANPDLPAPIIVNEYVDMTRAFFSGTEAKIVNAILDKFAKVIRG